MENGNKPLTAEEFINKKLGDKNFTHTNYTINRNELSEWLNEFIIQSETNKSCVDIIESNCLKKINLLSEKLYYMDKYSEPNHEFANQPTYLDDLEIMKKIRTIQDEFASMEFNEDQLKKYFSITVKLNSLHEDIKWFTHSVIHGHIIANQPKPVVSEDELFKKEQELQKLFIEAFNVYKPLVAAVICVKAAKDYFKGLSLQSEGKGSEWISVKDRLPEEGNWYLVIERNQVNFLFYDSIGIWLCRTDANDDEAEWNHEVTHWMPLPEPPKE